MSVSGIFPTYPLALTGPPHSKIKFGTRKIYVDVPWKSYAFLFKSMNDILEGKLNLDEIKQEWSEFLKENKELIFEDKPIVSIFPQSLKDV